MSTTEKKIASLIAQIPHRRQLRMASLALAGCPDGGWGQTDQAIRQLGDLLPAEIDVGDWVAAVYTVDERDGRYRTRPEILALI